MWICRRRARSLDIKLRLEWVLVVAYHIVMGAALVLMVTGINQAVNGNPQGISWTTQTSVWLKAIMAVIFVCWGILLGGILFSLRMPGNAARPAAFNDGTKVRCFSLLLYLIESTHA